MKTGYVTEYQMLLNIYILSLYQGRFYVGRSKSPMQRIWKHKHGMGSQWTQQWGVKYVFNIYETSNIFEEDMQTKKLMLSHGIQYVRGGSYSSAILVPHQLLTLQIELDTATHSCFKCGNSLYAGAPHICRSPPICYYCKSPGHRMSSCPEVFKFAIRH